MAVGLASGLADFGSDRQSPKMTSEPDDYRDAPASSPMDIPCAGRRDKGKQVVRDEPRGREAMRAVLLDTLAALAGAKKRPCSLASLPVELVLLILEHVHGSDALSGVLYSLALVCRSLNAVAMPLLYQRPVLRSTFAWAMLRQTLCRPHTFLPGLGLEMVELDLSSGESSAPKTVSRDTDAAPQGWLYGPPVERSTGGGYTPTEPDWPPFRPREPVDSRSLSALTFRLHFATSFASDSSRSKGWESSTPAKTSSSASTSGPFYASYGARRQDAHNDSSYYPASSSRMPSWMNGRSQSLAAGAGSLAGRSNGTAATIPPGISATSADEAIAHAMALGFEFEDLARMPRQHDVLFRFHRAARGLSDAAVQQRTNPPGSAGTAPPVSYDPNFLLMQSDSETEMEDYVPRPGYRTRPGLGYTSVPAPATASGIAGTVPGPSGSIAASASGASSSSSGADGPNRGTLSRAQQAQIAAGAKDKIRTWGSKRGSVHISISASSLLEVFKLLKSLKVLNMANSTIFSDTFLPETGEYQSLLSSTPHAYLDRVSITVTEAFRSLIENCTNIEALNLRSCDFMTDALVRLLVENLPNLTYLDLAGCTKVSQGAQTVFECETAAGRIALAEAEAAQAATNAAAAEASAAAAGAASSAAAETAPSAAAGAAPIAENGGDADVSSDEDGAKRRKSRLAALVLPKLTGPTKK